MIWKIALVLGVIGVHGDEAVSEQRVVIHHPKHAAVISQAEDKQENHKDYAWSYPSYEFSYKVKDPHTHDIKGQTEERDGDKVKGDYWLVEPTGRKRIVKYHADDEVGFNAHIDYSKYEHFHNEKEENNQVENGRLNSQEGDQLQEQKNGDNYEVTEDNNNGENENNEGEGKIEMENTDGNIQQEETLNNREENGGNDFKEQNENNNNNENQEPVMPESDAIVTLEALNENTESRDNCKCNERRQIAYRSNRNVVKNNNDGGQELASRKKRKNNNRSINVKREDNGEHLKHIKMHEVEKNNIKKSNPSEGKKKSQTDNLNDKKKIQESVNFGNRNNKRKQSRTHEDHKYEEKSQNNTTKNEAIKESEVIDQNDDDHKYQHRILIHHPKAVLPTPKKN